MHVTLAVTEGPHQGRAFSFEGHDHFIVGRAPVAHFRLAEKDRFFSRFHFMIEVNPPRCRLIDLKSTNGTRVNGRKVQMVDLYDGDAIRAGKTVLRVALHETPVASRADIPVSPVGLVAADVEHEGALDSPELEPEPLPVISGIDARDNRIGSSNPRILGYRIVRKVAEGGMGIVWLAVRKADGRQVALKTIQPAIVGTAIQTQRFLREARILGQLDHPNIVAFHEAGEADGLLYFAMEFVPGVDVAALQKACGGPLPVDRAVKITCQLLSALEYAHARKFVHRDIKPSNLLVEEKDGRDVVQLTDFGLARIYETSPLSGLTLHGDWAGTRSFIAPEQITNFRDSKPAVDQYAAAATLYKLLTDQYVYDLPDSLQLQLLMILQDDPVPIQSRRPDLPKALAEVVHRALAREPAERFPDVTAMRKALWRFRGVK